MIDWRELVRHCTVIAGRTVELSFMYMGEVATNLPIDSQVNVYVQPFFFFFFFFGLPQASMKVTENYMDAQITAV